MCNIISNRVLYDCYFLLNTGTHIFLFSKFQLLNYTIQCGQCISHDSQKSNFRYRLNVEFDIYSVKYVRLAMTEWNRLKENKIKLTSWGIEQGTAHTADGKWPSAERNYKFRQSNGASSSGWTPYSAVKRRSECWSVKTVRMRLKVYTRTSECEELSTRGATHALWSPHPVIRKNKVNYVKAAIK